MTGNLALVLTKFLASNMIAAMRHASGALPDSV